MPPRTKRTRHQRRVLFPVKLASRLTPKQANMSSAASTSPAPQPSSTSKSPQPESPITVLGDGNEQNDDNDGFVDEEIFVADAKGFPAHMIPDLYTEPPPIRDALVTETSRVQDKTVDVCLPYLTGEEDGHLVYNPHGVPSLEREKHIGFLHKSLGRLPGGFVAADASRPWFLYWALSGLVLLGEDVSSYREAVIETALSFQNEQGGFGGGGKQTSHLATTYATVLAIALVGGEEAYEVIDRDAMWRWLCSLKQPDGGFQVCVGGEEDIRGAYCATVIITLLNIPLELTPASPAREGGLVNLLAGLGDYVRRCQTYEGGISGQPNAEAHGAYAFCALGCLSLLDDPRRIFHRYLNVPRLITWLSSRQYAPEGGFSGRTNKLVDGCYSHWVGACFPLIEACLSPASSGSEPAETATAAATTTHKLPPASETLFSREGLIRYILCCCQDETRRGGLRDKPGKMSDSYHTNYVLAGLSAAQHFWTLSLPLEEPAVPVPPSPEPVANPPEWSVLPLYLADGREAGGDDEATAATTLFNQSDRVRPVHPVYALPQEVVDTIRGYFFIAKEGAL
ncbi:protein farnesyltransferase subunit beta [Rhypophila decipiens]|uniref:Protein farnesyltransferase subunit beta n=1 Tax=Rhypophila decipiens TaxID=261697 RepID=A0AAN7BDM1_9PEZI|nr:protein farnesyltransferase subunit beta [Rhypophila decipiens]